MKWLLARIFRKAMPLNVVQRRRQTEEVVRGMFEKYRGKSLDEEFRRVGVKDHEADVLFDEIDIRYGKALSSFDLKETDAALNGAFLRIADLVTKKQKAKKYGALG
jgi:hypothetical protein